MKNTKRFKALVGGFVLGFMLCVFTPLNTMISQKSTSKRIHVPQPVQQEQPVRYKSGIVWVKTSDNVFMKIPQWQIDQMKSLQQKDNPPVDASMITSGDLALVQKALNSASNSNEFEIFCDKLTQGEKTSLINNAFILEMQGLASLLMSYIFPKEIQAQMGASVIHQAGIIAPVIDYLKIDSVKRLLLSHTGIVHHAVFSPDGNRIVSAATGIKNNLILYNVLTGEEKSLFTGTHVVNDVVFSPNGQYIATIVFNSITLLDGSSGQKIKNISYPKYWVNGMVFSLDSNYILVSYFTNLKHFLILHDIKTDKRSEMFKDVNVPNFSEIILSLNGKYIVGGIGNKRNTERVILLDATTGRRIRAFQGLAIGKVSVAISPDSNYIVAGSSEGDEFIVWDVETAEKRAFLKGHDGVLKCVTFSPDGKYIVSGSSGNQNNLIVWDGKTGELLTKVEGFKNVHCVAFSPDGNYLLCGGEEGLKLLKFITPQILYFIATQLNLAQARFLYRLYLAKINNVSVIMDSKDLDYQLYLTLPKDVQQTVKEFFPFELASDIAEKEVQEKMNEYRSSLFHYKTYVFGKGSEKTHDEKMKAVKDVMSSLDKNSASYKACERLLLELEQEAAFDA